MEKKMVAVKAFVDEEVRNSFKAACAKKGTTMSDTLAAFIKKFIDDAENPKKVKKDTWATITN